MPTGVSLFVLLPEERAKWVKYAGQAGPRDPQSGQGPKTDKAGTRTLYRRKDVEQWLAEVDRRSEPMGGRKNARSEPTPGGAIGWYEKAVEAAGRIAPAHTPPCMVSS